VALLCAALDIGALVLTRSEEGISLFDRGCVHYLPAHQVEIADVTGAGDTVIAVLAMLVAADVPLAQALPVANRAGALSVSKFGTAALSPAELLGGCGL
jgi:bifunctional ADP-heptose synthase (sugar kinase/adenylyltransferase)